MALVPENIQMQHLAWRAGFGENLPVINGWAKRKRKETVKKVLAGRDSDMEPLRVINETDLPDYKRLKEMNAEERRAIQKLNTDGIKDLNVSWMNAMIKTGQIGRAHV